MSESKNIVAAPSDIVQEALRYSLSTFNDNHDRKAVYHNYQFCISVCEKITEIIEEESNIDTNDAQQAQLAAIFYTLGIVDNRKSPLPSAQLLWKEFSAKHAIATDSIKAVTDCLKSFFENQIKNTDAKKLLEDGIHAQIYAQEDATQIALYKMECQSYSDTDISNLEWNTQQYEKLQDITFHFPYSKLQYKPLISQNLLDYAQKIKRNKRNGPKAWEHEKLRNFQNLEKRLPSDATQTFFRANFRNHINLSAIADQKANIMISVNAIMISVLISVLSYRNITETNPKVIVPVVIFLIAGLASLICAVLSARPKVTSLNRSNMPIEELQRNIVFFGNFVHLNLEQYEEAMDAMFRDNELIYGNMTRDLYYLGKVLQQKYSYLSISYNVFMVGFVATVLTFLVAFLS